VVSFPELSLTGYELELAEKLAMSKDDPRLLPLVDAASSLSLTIIAGAPVRIGGELYIGAFIVDPAGRISLYTKQHLGAFGESARRDGTVPPPEASVFRPGDLDPLVPFGDGGVGAIAICADTGHASHPRRAAERGATAYLASMFVIPSDLESDSSKLRRYAVEHSMLVALSNFGKSTGGLQAAGRSSIWSEQGELLAELPASGSGIVVARGSRGSAISLELNPSRP
jgi:predicted amidohydrolase